MEPETNRQVKRNKTFGRKRESCDNHEAQEREEVGIITSPLFRHKRINNHHPLLLLVFSPTRPLTIITFRFK